MMSLSDAVNGFSGEVAWNCADRSLFGACQLETGDQVQVVSSYFGNVIIKANGKRLAITRDAAELMYINVYNITSPVQVMLCCAHRKTRGGYIHLINNCSRRK